MNEALQFGPALRARFIDRPNRFLVRCELDGPGVIEAFMPNPGRMWELLFPGVTLLVKRNSPAIGSSASTRRTDYTVLAVERDGIPILLQTHLTNNVVRHLIETKQIPGLRRAEIVRAECPVGGQRFDFLLRQGGRQRYLEVKSCTLFANRVAMFPDAVTERGRRHVAHLASHSLPGAKSCVLFLVHTTQVDWFMPDYHTDLAFAQTLVEEHNRLQVLPIAVEWTEDLSLTGTIKLLETPWAHLRREVQDRGSYMVILRLDEDRRFNVGRLGETAFRRGYYVYVGSAMRNLSARLARHTRHRKKWHWHIDYLRQHASEVVPVAIRSSRRHECEIARAMAAAFPTQPIGFGSSDCDCPGHLFFLQANPLDELAFHRVLQQFRMQVPA